MEIESGFVHIGDAKLYYEMAGEGQPLVLIHAGVADSRQWNNEFAHFAREYRVLRFDMRGFGKSHPVEGEFSLIGDLMAVLERLGFEEPVVLLGCSMGGSLAMNFTLEHPSRVKALVMVGSGPSGLSLDVPDLPLESEAEEAEKAGDLDRLAEVEARIWFDGMGRTAQQVNPSMRGLALEMNRLALEHDAKKLGVCLPDTEIPAAERLGEIRVPVLVVVGEHDIPYIQVAADYMVENIPIARKVTIEDAAHLPNMDHPEVFQKMVGEFLMQVMA